MRLPANTSASVVDLSTIQRMVKEINDLFAQRNLATAAAFLPAQKLNSGIVHVQIVEGRLGKVVDKGANAMSKDFVLFARRPETWRGRRPACGVRPVGDVQQHFDRAHPGGGCNPGRNLG